MSLDRRVFLGGVAVMVLPATASGQGASSQAAAANASVNTTTKDRGAGDGFTILEAAPGLLRLAPAPAAETAVWAYNGQVPGPLLRIAKGADLKARLVNKLAQPTSLCWHGVRAPNAMDGVAGLTQAEIKPGESFDYAFTPPDSGLYWYHPHVHPVSAEQIGRGLYGVLIVDEPEPPAHDEELVVVFDDWSLDAKHQIKGDFLDVDETRHQGRIGPLVTVNSRPAPLSRVARPGARIRLRLLSVTSARIMIVTFEGASPMVQAIDGQPCELFEPVRRTLPIGPGARFDVMIDLPAEPGKTVVLVLRGEGGADRQLLAFETEGEKVPPRAAIAALTPNPALPAMIRLERALKMDLVINGGVKPAPAVAPVPEPPGERAGSLRTPRHGKLGAAPAPTPTDATDAVAKAKPPRESVTETPPPLDPTRLWTINGVASDGFSGKPLFKVRRGAPVSLALVNKSAFALQIHVHGHALRLLHDLDDGWEPYWREAILVAEGHTKHIAFVADNPGKWAIESLILDRQVTGLAAWFEVT
jgi:FtsP/CotA-like multicopper oxidase with cupredoxin domain